MGAGVGEPQVASRAVAFRELLDSQLDLSHSTRLIDQLGLDKLEPNRLRENAFCCYSHFGSNWRAPNQYCNPTVHLVVTHGLDKEQENATSLWRSQAKQGYPWAFGQKRNGGHLDPISCLGLIKHAGHPGRNISTQLSVISNNFRYRDASAAGHEFQGAFS
ncbi:hypothetical protein PGTUg99_026036 [Puccinia graminis f. sp. tritici]|uniref:Uncharacterized protein n=1 Tax=Puccinia graminis f. sp. tritici TaxID=56615 RepID=A0A5B0RUQ4_PUCGR|nr:hypothetical protein PGTUg99_026036 [Puccinia graminis f. sp. tritici]